VTNEVESLIGVFNSYFSKVTLYQVNYQGYFNDEDEFKRNISDDEDIKVC
jgi:hypothetical protein